MDKEGFVDDPQFIKLGYPAPAFARPASISGGEHNQRAKIMNHQNQVKLRAEKHMLIITAEVDKKMKVKVKADKWLGDNAACERKIFRVMGIPETSGRRLLVGATMMHFFECIIPQLKAFIFTRVHANPMASCGSLPKKKGSLAAAEGGEDTLILRAYNKREERTMKLKAIQLEPTSVLQQALQRVVPVPDIMEVCRETDPKQYIFIPTTEYINRVKAVFDPFGATSFPDISIADLQEKTLVLSEILLSRLNTHINKIKDAPKRNNLVWRFVRVNIGRVAASMIIFGHITDDFEVACWDPGLGLLDCDFAKGVFQLVMNSLIGTMEGCYLYYCKVTCTFVRSGSTTGETRNMGIHNTEHHKSMDDQNGRQVDSKFQRSYPTKKHGKIFDGMRRGYFENLIPV